VLRQAYIGVGHTPRDLFCVKYVSSARETMILVISSVVMVSCLILIIAIIMAYCRRRRRRQRINNSRRETGDKVHKSYQGLNIEEYDVRLAVVFHARPAAALLRTRPNQHSYLISLMICWIVTYFSQSECQIKSDVGRNLKVPH